MLNLNPSVEGFPAQSAGALRAGYTPANSARLRLIRDPQSGESCNPTTCRRWWDKQVVGQYTCSLCFLMKPILDCRIRVKSAILISVTLFTGCVLPAGAHPVAVKEF